MYYAFIYRATASYSPCKLYTVHRKAYSILLSLSLAVNCAGTFFWTVTNLKLEINLKKILGGFYG